MKNNIDWYPHYTTSHEHPKIEMLRVQYGWEGEGKFWALNNRIAEAEGCKINLTKKYNKASLATYLDFTLDELDKFLKYLEKDCGLIIKKNNYITTKRVKETWERVMQKRKHDNKMYGESGKQDDGKGLKQHTSSEKEIPTVEKEIPSSEKTHIKRDDIEEEVNINTPKQELTPEDITNLNLFYKKSPFDKAKMQPKSNPNFIRVIKRVELKYSIKNKGLAEVIEKCDKAKKKNKREGYYLNAIENACTKSIEIGLEEEQKRKAVEGKQAPKAAKRKNLIYPVRTVALIEHPKREKASYKAKALVKATSKALGNK